MATSSTACAAPTRASRGRSDGQDQRRWALQRASVGLPRCGWKVSHSVRRSARMTFNPNHQIEPHDCMAELYDAMPRQHHPDRPQPDIWTTSRWAISSRRWSPAKSAPPPCRTRSTDRLREFRSNSSGNALLKHLLENCRSRACSATLPTPRIAQHGRGTGLHPAAYESC